MIRRLAAPRYAPQRARAIELFEAFRVLATPGAGAAGGSFDRER